MLRLLRNFTSAPYRPQALYNATVSAKSRLWDSSVTDHFLLRPYFVVACVSVKFGLLPGLATMTYGIHPLVD